VIWLLAATCTCAVTGVVVPTWADTVYVPDGVPEGMSSCTLKEPLEAAVTATQVGCGREMQTWTRAKAAQPEPVTVSWAAGETGLGDKAMIGVGPVPPRQQPSGVLPVPTAPG
jgi:hypothetical protein